MQNMLLDGYIIYFLRTEYLQEKQHLFTLISRKAVGQNVHAAIPKGNMGYDQYTVPDTVDVEPNFVAFL